MSSSEEMNTPSSTTAENISKSKRRWFALESNPALWNSYVTRLGLDTTYYEFVDVFSTESWALEMIPQPVMAVLMLYPISKNQEDWRREEEEQRKQKLTQVSPKVWFMKQRIGNACGTIGLIHALANLPPQEQEQQQLVVGGWLKEFLDRCPATLDGYTKADLLESDTILETLHEDAATDQSLNCTNKGNIDDDIDTHFIALVCVDGGLYELDGRKEGPILHGETTSETFLSDACDVIKQFMSRDPEEMRFTIVALAPKSFTE